MLPSLSQLDSFFEKYTKTFIESHLMNRFLFGLLLAITYANLFVYRKLLGNKMGALYMYRTWFFLLLTHSYCIKLIQIFHIHFLHKAFAKYGLSLCLMFAFPSSFIGFFFGPLIKDDKRLFKNKTYWTSFAEPWALRCLERVDFRVKTLSLSVP